MIFDSLVQQKQNITLTDAQMQEKKIQDLDDLIKDKLSDPVTIGEWISM